MISAEGAWGKEDGGAVFIFTDGNVNPNGPTLQMEPLTVVEALHLCDQILKAAKQALQWEVSNGDD
jgi:hypothetical protein